MNKRGDFTFAKIAGLLILMALLVWFIFFSKGLREYMFEMIYNIFK